MGTFYTHLKDAILINTHRKPFYLKKTQGKSRLLSDLMIWSERTCLPLALYFDMRARPFNIQGIPIVQNDFITMQDISDINTPLLYKNLAGDDTFKHLQEDLLKAINVVLLDIEQANLQMICQHCYFLLHHITDTERANQANFAMTKHIIESVAFSALNGIQYHKNSSGKTLPLTKAILKAQLHPLKLSLLIDKQAQKHHLLDCGIIVNDVPRIPFLENYP